MSQMILGTWIFVNLLYHGEILPPPNPELKIIYQFNADGSNHLHYHREGQKGSCDRVALYEFDGQTLYQQVTWVAPHNADFCSQDPDMRLGSVNRTHAKIENGKFYLTLGLGEETVDFIWEKKSVRLSEF